MRKLTLAFLALLLGTTLSAQRNPPSLECNICLGLDCGNHFNLTQGNSYTFSTSATPGANYSWSTVGPLSIVGSRTQSSVQVQATGMGNGLICMTKSVDGQPPCCVCDTVTISGTPNCADIVELVYTNNPGFGLNVLCCDAAANFFRYNCSPSGTGITSTVTFRDANTMAIVNQYYNVPEGTDIDFPNGLSFNNQNPPPCGEYFVLVQSNCDPQDVLGGNFHVVSCNYGKPHKGLTDKETVLRGKDIKMEVYPNPLTSQTLNIRVKGLENKADDDARIQFRLLDIGFTKVLGTWTFDSFAENYTVQTPNLAKGTYLLVTNVLGRSMSTKLVVR